MTRYITERAYIALQQLPPNVNRPLRLDDELPNWGFDTSTPTTPIPGMEYFPMSHLRLFGLIKAEHVSCWRGLCDGSRGCTAWSGELAMNTMMTFKEEMDLAKRAWAGRTGLAVQTVNLIITIAWFRE
jgi:hypothetical protein